MKSCGKPTLEEAWALFRLVYNSEHSDPAKGHKMRDRFGHLLDTKMKDFVLGKWGREMYAPMLFFSGSRVVYIIDSCSRLPFGEERDEECGETRAEAIE